MVLQAYCTAGSEVPPFALRLLEAAVSSFTAQSLLWAAAPVPSEYFE